MGCLTRARPALRLLITATKSKGLIEFMCRIILMSIIYQCINANCKRVTIYAPEYLGGYHDCWQKCYQQLWYWLPKTFYNFWLKALNHNSLVETHLYFIWFLDTYTHNWSPCRGRQSTIYPTKPLPWYCHKFTGVSNRSTNLTKCMGNVRLFRYITWM